jgi:hypothetical protein
MCASTLWVVRPDKGTITKDSGSVSGGKVTAVKFLRGTFSMLYWVSIFSKWASFVGVVFSGGLAALAAIGMGLLSNIAIVSLLIVLLPTCGLVCTLSLGAGPLLNFLRHWADRVILFWELPQNPPIDIRRALNKAGGMRAKLGTIIPRDYILGGTRKFSMEIETDIKLPLANNVEYSHKVRLVEILKGSEIIGYVVRGRDSKTYCYIKHNDITENFWKQESWQVFSTASEFSAAIGGPTP